MNSAARTLPLDVSPAERDRILANGLAFEQTIAIPVTGNLLLRLGVQEDNTGRISTLNLPVEDVRLTSPAK